MRILIGVLAFIGVSCGTSEAPLDTAACDVALLVLGVGQDGGKPQIGQHRDPAWSDPALARLATSIAVIDRRQAPHNRYLFDATPDLKRQLYELDRAFPSPELPMPGLAGIFLTHAHIGHYTGLMLLGHEAMGANRVPVYAMPRMADFLANNGPWSQLVRYENITLTQIEAGKPTRMDGLAVTPLLVPHRQEFSEVLGFRIEGPARSALYLPDIDSWAEWDEAGTRIEDVLETVDLAYLDATFFADGEIPGRDMSGFPHPFIRHSMDRFQDLPEETRAKVRFIHLNHTNPALTPGSAAQKEIRRRGYGLAERGEVQCL